MTVRFDSKGNQLPVVNARADITDTVYDIGSVLSHGNIPDFPKDSLNGQNVTIVGITGPEEFQLGEVYFLLLYRDNDPRTIDAWGVMISATSPAAKRALQMAQNGYLPFRAKMALVKSTANKGYEYWTLDKADAPALPA